MNRLGYVPQVELNESEQKCLALRKDLYQIHERYVRECSMNVQDVVNSIKNARITRIKFREPSGTSLVFDNHLGEREIEYTPRIYEDRYSEKLFSISISIDVTQMTRIYEDFMLRHNTQEIDLLFRSLYEKLRNDLFVAMRIINEDKNG